MRQLDIYGVLAIKLCVRKNSDFLVSENIEMVTIYENPASGNKLAQSKGLTSSYAGPVKMDIKIPPPAKPVLNKISVNGVVIPEADIMKEAQNHPAKNPEMAIASAARALVVKQLLLSEAKRIDIKPFPKIEADGARETAEDAAIRILIEKEVKAPKASEDEALRYYENNKNRFISEAIYEARHILLPVKQGNEKARELVNKEALGLIEILKKDMGKFSKLAKEFSACSSKEQGGNLGQLTSGSTVKEFEEKLHIMREGELYPQPVATPFGVHIIVLDRKIEGREIPFEMAKSRIIDWLEAASWSKAISQYIGMLAGKAEVLGIDFNSSDSPLVQ